ncbi:MAG: 2OG-Fe(II) oxygenase [Chitinophagaceae bacterium]|nr:2OG-Fe(II) oxygenase [Chitinophagaceae bacterium]
MNEAFEQLINSFIDHEVGIAPHFLNEKLAEGLRQNINHLQHDDLMADAGIGNETGKERAHEMRKDKIYWMDESHDNIFEQEFLQMTGDFIRYLNRTCYTGINACEFHYAVYEPGSFYRRHRDQFRNDDQRKFSFISYLNTDWLESDGGNLLLYHPDSVQSVSPESGTTVLFKSDGLEHEVSLANRRRMSVTGWLKQV